MHNRKSIRLKDFDYSLAWWYYVTICTKNHSIEFGTITNGSAVLNDKGKIVLENWEYLPNHFTNIELDEFIIMPNHLHGIIIINERKGLINQTPTDQHWIMMKNPSITLGKIIRFFKARSTRLIHKSGNNSFLWQRNYYEHIIRNEKDLYNIRMYIMNNPVKWEIEKEITLENIYGS
jgi:REP element-mobilizing transposase RayT